MDFGERRKTIPNRKIYRVSTPNEYFCQLFVSGYFNKVSAELNFRNGAFGNVHYATDKQGKRLVVKAELACDNGDGHPQLKQEEKVYRIDREQIRISRNRFSVF